MLKKAFLFGLGAMSITKEKAEQFYNEMVEKGHMNKEEAKQFVDEAIKKGEEERSEIKKYFEKEIETFKKDFAVVNKEDFEALKRRVERLEEKVSTDES